MTRHILFVLPLLSLLGLQCLARTNGPAVGTEEYAVYSAVLEGVYSASHAKLLAVRGRTLQEAPGGSTPGERIRIMRHRLSPYPQDVAEDFIVKNAEPLTLGNHFRTRVRVRIVNDEEVAGFWRDWDTSRRKYPHWGTFLKKYPYSRGLIFLSRVGFSPDMRRALIYTGYACGGECGKMYYVLLAKKEGRWAVERKHLTGFA